MINEVLFAGRKLSTAAIMYHSALSQRQGLTATDEKAMDLIGRYGPLTAGELSQRSGLAPASITGLVTRLERAGAARRVRHPEDGRKVLIEIVPQYVTDTQPLFDDLVARMREICTRYSDEELATIARWITEAAEEQLAAAQVLGGDSS